MIRSLIAIAALSCSMPVLAKTITVEAGADAQERLQEPAEAQW